MPTFRNKISINIYSFLHRQLHLRRYPCRIQTQMEFSLCTFTTNQGHSSKSLPKGETSANGIVRKSLKKKKKSSVTDRKHYRAVDALDRLIAAISLPLNTAHLITTVITATILELLSRHHHQLEVNVGGRSYVLNENVLALLRSAQPCDENLKDLYII